ncbi:hypothetical protein NDU88_002847 [Pleurodeles waltl]|uniref:Uncharacterized protein n=1 Tax=Pleurodeles waltl TaxID=8319 RepID=A0AAV7NEU7_PLEWA|nr:hypothetical protein NDU88_002847 [Pleurodeles waltl]
MSQPRRPSSATSPPGQAFSLEGEQRVAGPQACVSGLSWRRSGPRQRQKGSAPDRAVVPVVSAPPSPPRDHRGP